MSKLSAFLHPAVSAEEKEIIISRRFIGEDGQPVPFRIRALTQEENDAITKRATRQVKVDGIVRGELDHVDFSRRMVVEATMEPDFKSTELCSHYGVADPTLVPGKMLLAGEYAALIREITNLSGFRNVEDEVKN